jgi:hypothetical protein
MCMIQVAKFLLVMHIPVEAGDEEQHIRTHTIGATHT